MTSLAIYDYSFNSHFFIPIQLKVVQNESRKRLQSETDSKRHNDKLIDELQSREASLLDQLSALKSDKQRLEDTVYRLKSESMSVDMSLKQLRDELEDEKKEKVSSHSHMCTVHAHVGLNKATLKAITFVPLVQWR